MSFNLKTYPFKLPQKGGCIIFAKLIRILLRSHLARIKGENEYYFYRVALSNTIYLVSNCCIRLTVSILERLKSYSTAELTSYGKLGFPFVVKKQLNNLVNGRPMLTFKRLLFVAVLLPINAI